MNKIKWTNQHGIKIEIVDRLAESGIRKIEFSSIKEIGNGYLIYGENETYIPFHRIIKVTKDGKVIWKKRFPNTRPS